LVARMKRQRNPGAAFRRRHRPRISLCCIRAANQKTVAALPQTARYFTS
jgi:hypothetical protein